MVKRGDGWEEAESRGGGGCWRSLADIDEAWSQTAAATAGGGREGDSWPRMVCGSSTSSSYTISAQGYFLFTFRISIHTSVTYMWLRLAILEFMGLRYSSILIGNVSLQIMQMYLEFQLGDENTIVTSNVCIFSVVPFGSYLDAFQTFLYICLSVHYFHWIYS
jgi:hypothetical protein